MVPGSANTRLFCWSTPANTAPAGAPTVAVTVFELTDVAFPPCVPEAGAWLVIEVPGATGSMRAQKYSTEDWPALRAPTLALTVPDAPSAGVVPAIAPTVVEGDDTPLPLQA